MTNNLVNIERFGLAMADSPTPYKEPRLFVSDVAEKQSYVEYYLFHPAKRKFIRKRIIVKGKTLAARKKNGAMELAEWKNLLKKGLVFTELASKTNQVSPINSNTLILQAAEFYIEQKKLSLSPNTLKGYNADIGRLKEFVDKCKPGLSLGNCTEVEAYEFVDYMTKISSRSTNNSIAGMTTLFNYYIDRKIIFNNPFRKIKRLPTTAKKHTAMPPAVCKLILSKADSQLQLFCQMLYYCMIRPGRELLGLQLKNIHENTVEVLAQNAKNRKTEHVGIPEALKVELAKWDLAEYPQDFYLFGTEGKPSQKPWTANYFYRHHRKILDDLDLYKYGYDLYCWKHSGAISLFKATQNIELVRRQCRHSDLATTQKYLRDLGLFMDYSEINKVPSLL
jgi:integrase